MIENLTDFGKTVLENDVLRTMAITVAGSVTSGFMYGYFRTDTRQRGQMAGALMVMGSSINMGNMYNSEPFKSAASCGAICAYGAIGGIALGSSVRYFVDLVVDRIINIHSSTR
jgi:hypothetical protein